MLAPVERGCFISAGRSLDYAIERVKRSAVAAPILSARETEDG